MEEGEFIIGDRVAIIEEGFITERRQILIYNDIFKKELKTWAYKVNGIWYLENVLKSTKENGKE